MILPPSKQTLAQAAKHIAHGGVIAFRTDTFYGLGADPFKSEAIGRIRHLKGREDAKPILLLISDASQVERFLAETTELFKAVAKSHWAGPLTLIGIARDDLPPGLTAGSGTVGLRLPNDEDVRNLVRVCGGALTGTSANPAKRPAARTAGEVEAYFPQEIDLIIDGGEVSATQPSTVLDLSGPRPQLIREGAITRRELRQWLQFNSKSKVQGPHTSGSSGTMI